MTDNEKILKFLTKRENVTYPGNLSTGVAKSRLKVNRLPARIYELREAGFDIFTNTKTKSDGSKVHVYRLHPGDVADARATLKSMSV